LISVVGGVSTAHVAMLVALVVILHYGKISDGVKKLARCVPGRGPCLASGRSSCSFVGTLTVLCGLPLGADVLGKASPIWCMISADRAAPVLLHAVGQFWCLILDRGRRYCECALRLELRNGRLRNGEPRQSVRGRLGAAFRLLALGLCVIVV
jgi:hypothetical protein